VLHYFDIYLRAGLKIMCVGAIIVHLLGITGCGEGGNEYLYSQ